MTDIEAERRFLDDRSFVDYMELAGFTEVEMATFTENLSAKSESLGRSVVIGDVGSGSNKAMQAFADIDHVETYGIDKNADPYDENNVHLISGNGMDEESKFWKRKYDYLFGIHFFQHIDPPVEIGEVINLFKKHLTEKGKAYIVVPEKQETIEGKTFVFNPSIIKDKTVEIIQTVDPRTNQRCYSLNFGKN